MLTLDANVFVSEASATEFQHSISTAFFVRLLQLFTPIYCPAIVLPETSAGIARPTGNIILARRTEIRISQLPGLVLIEVDEARARLASEIAIIYRLRGADAIYVATAQEFGATLVTWDNEMLARAALAVPTMTPTDWLAANPIS